MDGYRALKEGAGIGAIAPRRAIAVSGKDRAAYLQGLLTNDIQALTAGTGCYAAWLTPQGRMITDLHVLESGDMMLLDVPEDQLQPTIERLEQFLFSEDVQIADLSGALRTVWVHGPAASVVIQGVISSGLHLDVWRDYQNARGGFNGSPIVIARIDQLGVPGFAIYVEAGREHDLQRALEAAGALYAGLESIDAARIEAGYPIFGIDMTDDTIPLEAGIEDRAISLSKGCYVGQEVIIRVLHRGGGRVAKRLVGLRVEGDGMSAGEEIFAAGRKVGAVTSAAISPRLGAIALGYVHRDFVAPGTSVVVEGLAGEVIGRPM